MPEIEVRVLPVPLTAASVLATARWYVSAVCCAPTERPLM
jgi:hypothetical protein